MEVWHSLTCIDIYLFVMQPAVLENVIFGTVSIYFLLVWLSFKYDNVDCGVVHCLLFMHLSHMWNVVGHRCTATPCLKCLLIVTAQPIWQMGQ